MKKPCRGAGLIKSRLALKPLGTHHQVKQDNKLNRDIQEYEILSLPHAQSGRVAGRRLQFHPPLEGEHWPDPSGYLQLHC
jgi:hypothetical protein